ncbi:hypothetical protein V6E14_25630 [Serratia marcescens]|nr:MULTISPECIES: hypothetical protein [Enterobacteriaceae]EFH9173412.1 hypothetical protein [Escherichia coli]MCY0840957.1 hypothetical protein [Enterobacter cloacae complex sp. 2022EL-00759]
MVRLSDLTCAPWIIRVSQTIPGIDFTAQVIERLFCSISGRANVQALPGAKLNAGRHKMQLVMPGMGMPDPENVVLIGFKPRERDLFKAIHELPLHFRRDLLLRGERQHAGSVLVPEIERVDEFAGSIRRSPQYLWR